MSLRCPFLKRRSTIKSQQTIQNLVSRMTLEEKAVFCAGGDFWHTRGIERLKIPAVMMCDGPHGLRKQEGEADHLGVNASIETVCYPTASALGAYLPAFEKVTV